LRRHQEIGYRRLLGRGIDAVQHPSEHAVVGLCALCSAGMAWSSSLETSYSADMAALDYPAVFIGWGITSLVASPLLLVDWSVTALIGAAIAWITSDHIKIDHARVSLPGSAFPLIRNLLIFSAKYGLAVAAAISHSNLAVWDVAVSGASAGYFLGWLLRLASAYRQAQS
jgi:hypothetical protein